jgi:signal transduction histidine kinase
MKSLSIRQKIWLAIITVSTFTILIGISVSYYLYQTLYIEKQTEMLIMQGQQLEESYYNSPRDDLLQKLDWLEESSETRIIFTEDPMQLASGISYDSFAQENLITFSERQQLLKGETVIFSRVHSGLKQEVRAVVVPLFVEDRLEGAIFLYLPLTAISDAFQPIRLYLFSGLTILMILLIAAGTKITNELVKPIKEMEKVAGVIAKGNFSTKVETKGNDELASLGHSINTLSFNLDEVDRKRREFLGNVSQELRTPISYMKGYSEAMEEGIITSEKYVGIIQKETNRMDRLVHDLLDLAQLEGESYPIHEEPVILSELVQDVISRFELILVEKDMAVHTNLDEEVIVKGDYDRLDQVISNLVSNSIRYTPEHKAISITLNTEEQMGVLLVEDTGAGIPEKDLPHIFDRFYRVNKARTREDGGTGLGLSIVHQIVKIHGGDIKIESMEGAGTKAIVKIPLFIF